MSAVDAKKSALEVMAGLGGDGKDALKESGELVECPCCDGKGKVTPAKAEKYTAQENDESPEVVISKKSSGKSGKPNGRPTKGVNPFAK